MRAHAAGCTTRVPTTRTRAPITYRSSIAPYDVPMRRGSSLLASIAAALDLCAAAIDRRRRDPATPSLALPSTADELPAADADAFRGLLGRPARARRWW